MVIFEAIDRCSPLLSDHPELWWRYARPGDSVEAMLACKRPISDTLPSQSCSNLHWDCSQDTGQHLHSI
jgi:hypothetical protein